MVATRIGRATIRQVWPLRKFFRHHADRPRPLAGPACFLHRVVAAEIELEIDGHELLEGQPVAHGSRPAQPLDDGMVEAADQPVLEGNADRSRRTRARARSGSGMLLSASKDLIGPQAHVRLHADPVSHGCSAAVAADTCHSLVRPSAAGTRTGHKNSTPVRLIAVNRVAM